ncbi:MAG: D-alanyl-D-alanine carboxypeptidase family protein [Peptococcaceae bacterium]|nr:D-alanyl-D-alanine carboxypeptidase family protein [Peptococcaceae bacterium]
MNEFVKCIRLTVLVGIAVVVGFAGLWGLSGCNRALDKLNDSVNDAVTASLIVNGAEISEKCPVLFSGDTLLVPSVGILRELGVVALEPSEKNTLLAVTADHTFLHVPGTNEVMVDGQAVVMDQPSVVEDGEIFLEVSLFEEIMAAKISSDADDIRIEFAESGEIQGLLDLNEQEKVAYFLPDRLFRYADYAMKHPELDAEKAVIYVNADLDKPFYSDIKQITEPEYLLVLCNKYNQLPRDYQPKDLKPMGYGYFLREDAAEAYLDMIKAGAQDNLSFQLKSAFRSYDTQAGLYNSSVSRNGKDHADVASARPGHSEHQTGLALDVTQPTGDYSLSVTFDQTLQFEWLSKHAHEFGFILRYPADKIDITGFMYEPWHYRYVGKEVAAEIYRLGISFDEYVATHLIGIDESLRLQQHQ